MITNHTQLLNALIEKHGLKSYCEIGVQTTPQNFDKIICEEKDGIDPCLRTSINGSIRLIGATSDEYFERWAKPIDIFFLDGLHHKEQIKRDFENSLRCLSDNGFIVIHDILPENEITTCVPRGTQKIWHGDVYKWAMTISEYDDIAYKTFNIDNGCMLVWKCLGNGEHVDIWPEDDWNCFKACKNHLMNVTTTVEI